MSLSRSRFVQAPHTAFWKAAHEAEPEHVANDFTINYVHAFASQYAKDKYFPRMALGAHYCGTLITDYRRDVGCG